MFIVHSVGTVDESLKTGNKAHILGGHGSVCTAGNDIEGIAVEVGNVENKTVVGGGILGISSVVKDGFIDGGSFKRELGEQTYGILKYEKSILYGDFCFAVYSRQVELFLIKLEHLNRSLKSKKSIADGNAVFFVNIAVSDVGRNVYGAENRKQKHYGNKCCYNSFHKFPPREFLVCIITHKNTKIKRFFIKNLIK